MGIAWAIRRFGTLVARVGDGLNSCEFSYGLNSCEFSYGLNSCEFSYGLNSCEFSYYREERMPYGFYISAEGAHAQTTRLEVIAHNLANVDTVGFKRDLAVLQSRYAEETQRGEDFPGSESINDVGGGVVVRETKTDYSQGPFKHTKVPTDVAIRGDGFFVVSKNDQQYLTRAGNFRITPQGDLLTQQGFPVLGVDGAPVTINPAGGPWEMTTAGGIRQGANVRDLAIVMPQNPSDLARAGENLFRPLADPDPIPHNRRQVAVGYLEASGVRPAIEMIDMIEASRAVEANMNMMKTQDEMLSELVTRVLRTS